uniref:U1-type domain-containing protein n=1 Tax=Eutreptiella gymnastica TaxID=73025 RepID=A0A7S1J126_9EUGL|mmetsp:Transcript_590/g.1186  ORF Transcript_590/g.1186 Transcript_590/m.1186 type:complete len:358 (+) Transcript_590:155-1228(+)
MCEYWKSVARWRCPYCKCDIQDTVASRRFHENGKRHKEAVERHRMEMTVKNYQRQMARDEVAEDLKKIEEAALKSYLANDAHQGDGDKKEDAQKQRKPSASMMTVSAGSSAVPKYGTKEYAEWYYAQQTYHASQGSEKVMDRIVAPKESQDMMTKKAHNKLEKEIVDGGFTMDDHEQQNNPPEAEPEVDDDSDELETFDRANPDQGPMINSWSTISVRRLDATTRPQEDEPEPEVESSEDETEKNAYKDLKFNFSSASSSTKKGHSTGFRMTSFKLEQKDERLFKEECGIKQEILSMDQSTWKEVSTPTLTALVPKVKLEPGIKVEPEDHEDQGLKRKASTFASKGKKQFRRKTDDD